MTRGEWLWRTMLVLLLAQLIGVGGVILIGPPSLFEAASYDVLRAFPLCGQEGVGVIALSVAAAVIVSGHWGHRGFAAVAPAGFAFWAIWTGCIIAAYWTSGATAVPGWITYGITTASWAALSLSVPLTPEDR